MSSPKVSTAVVDPFEGKALVLALTALSSFVAIGLAMVRSKVSAVVLGSDGLGVVSEVGQIATWLLVPFAILSGPALTRAIAGDDGSGGQSRPALQSSIRLGLWAGLLVPVASAAVAAFVFRDFPNTGFRVGWTTLSAIGAWGTAFIVVLSTALIAARNPIRASVLNLVQNVLIAVGSIIGTLVAGVEGLLVGVAIGAVVTLPWAIRSMWRVLGELKQPKVPLDRSYLKLGASLGAAALAAGFFSQGVLTVLRLLAFDVGGSPANGQLQAVMAVSATYFGSVLTSLGALAFPAFAAARGADELSGVVAATVRRVLIMAPPVILLAIALRVPAMQLLYGSEFKIAAGVLGVQMAGDLAKAVSWALVGPLLLRGAVRAYVVADLLANAALAGCAVLFVEIGGFAGFGYAYAAGYAVSVVVNAALLKRTFQVRLPYGMVAASLVGTGVLVLLGSIDASPWLEIVCGVVGCIWAVRVGALTALGEFAMKAIRKLRTLKSR